MHKDRMKNKGHMEINLNDCMNGIQFFIQYIFSTGDEIYTDVKPSIMSYQHE